MYSGTSLLGTPWNLDFSPYYRGPQFRGHLIHYSTTLGHRMVALLRGFCYSEVCNREVPL